MERSTLLRLLVQQFRGGGPPPSAPAKRTDRLKAPNLTRHRCQAERHQNEAHLGTGLLLIQRAQRFSSFTLPDAREIFVASEPWMQLVLQILLLISTLWHDMVQATITASYCLQSQLLTAHLKALRKRLLLRTCDPLDWMRVSFYALLSPLQGISNTEVFLGETLFGLCDKAVKRRAVTSPLCRTLRITFSPEIFWYWKCPMR